jgi:hypothetical protein
MKIGFDGLVRASAETCVPEDEDHEIQVPWHRGSLTVSAGLACEFGRSCR